MRGAEFWFCPEAHLCSIWPFKDDFPSSQTQFKYCYAGDKFSEAETLPRTKGLFDRAALRYKF